MARSYIKINNYSNNGNLYIASKVFKDIAIDKIKNTKGVYIGNEEVSKKGKNSDFDFDKNVICTYKDGYAELYININVKKGVDVNKICINLQKEISDEIFVLLEQVPVKIKIKVGDII
jgi:uncharacterized alkaline shock family protein YloU